MKRIGQIEIITAVIMIVTSLAGPAWAAITWSGDLDPSDPSTWDSSTSGRIGYYDNGTMSITGGSGVIDLSGILGYGGDTMGEVTVDGVGSTWTNSDNLWVGYNGNGTLNITSGGAVSNGDVGSVIGGWANSTGAVTVDGAGSTWTNGSGLYVGHYGNGTLNITGGGAVSNGSGRIGYGTSSTGAVTVNSSGSTWTNSGSLFVGLNGDGTLNITGGGAVSNSFGWIASGGTGAVTVDGAGSTWTNNDYLYVGNESNGTLNITGGGAVSNVSGKIGSYFGGIGEVTVDGAGSRWTNSNFLRVDDWGKGTLNITGGGEVSNVFGYIGNRTGLTGEVTVDGAGSTWTNNDYLYVGSSGSGTLNITRGGLVSVAGTLTIDYDGGDDSFINMATGGMLAVFGDADDSLVDFLGIIAGTDAIRYWDSSIADWADITGATLGIDYTLEYLTEGDLAGYTMLTVPESTEPTIPVTIDIRPGTCPNPLRVNFVGQGSIKVAIVGSADLDVLEIDVATLTLEGVAPIKSSYKDVSTFGAEACECTTLGQDGFLDLELKFDRSSLLEALEESVGDLSAIGHRTLLPLTLEGMLYEEIADVELQGSDCVAIRNRGAIKRRK